MPLSVNFSVSQSLANPNQLTFTDTSTGSDGTITGRRIYILDAYGNYLVESGTTTQYEEWAYPFNTVLTLDVLSKATTPNITVKWMNGSSVVYEKTVAGSYLLHLYKFGFSLTRGVLSKPTVIQDTDYYISKIKLIVDIDDAENAISYNSDIVNAQSAADRGTHLEENQSKYF